MDLAQTILDQGNDRFANAKEFFDTLSDSEQNEIWSEMQQAKVRDETPGRKLEKTALSMFSHFAHAATWTPGDKSFFDWRLWEVSPEEHRKLRDAWAAIIEVAAACRSREMENDLKSELESSQERIRENVDAALALYERPSTSA